MQLYLNDLGRQRYLTLLRRRTMFGGTQSNLLAASNVTLSSDDVPEHKGSLTAYWTQNLRARDPETRAKAATLAKRAGGGAGVLLGTIFGSYIAFGLMLAALALHNFFLFIAMAAWVFGLIMLWRGGVKKYLEKQDSTPLTASEVESLLPTARGSLDRAYLALVLDALRQNIPVDHAQNDVRAALTALGETVTQLPAEAPSHGRAAEAYHAAEEQVSALRDVLATFDEGMGVAVGRELTNYASEAIKRASGAANASALARREIEDIELETLYGAPLPSHNASAAPPTAPTTTTVTPSQLQQKTLRVGKWWHGGGSA